MLNREKVIRSAIGEVRESGYSILNISPELQPEVTAAIGHAVGLRDWQMGEPEHLVARLFGSLTHDALVRLTKQLVTTGYITTQQLGGLRRARFVLPPEIFPVADQYRADMAAGLVA